MKRLFTLLAIATLICSCNKVKDKTKETLNKGGEAVGEMATEFTEGVTEGVERTLDCKIVLSEELKAGGISYGKFHIENDSLGNDNKLVIYIITEKDYKGNLTFKVTDKKGVEFGRQQLALDAKAGAAGYYDVVFDPRTDIEVKSTIEIN
ncbi:hypothetical protein ACLI09_06140 [Flavobacterium sp. RHBU_24]|uniref:hypothetical protein n=1 Tax=Flavobacterium sp. RHBU_24 TaxID=3391185 RepID=UPI00398543D0